MLDFYHIKNMPKFPFLNENNHIISFVGGGGKTSTMYTLANFYANKGLKVICTTTTHIKMPQNLFFAENFEQMQDIWEQGKFAVIGQKTLDSKLKMLPYDKLIQFVSKADIVLIESDGAKMMPIKVPLPHEPVLIDDSDIVVAVVGLDSLNKKIKDVCFRWESAIKLLGKSENDLLTMDDVYKIIVSKNGLRKGCENKNFYVLLNKCKKDDMIQINKLVSKLKQKLGFDKVYIVMKEG